MVIRSMMDMDYEAWAIDRVLYMKHKLAKGVSEPSEHLSDTMVG